MNVDQDEIDAILGKGGQNVEDEKGQSHSIDDIVSQALKNAPDTTTGTVDTSSKSEPESSAPATSTLPENLAGEPEDNSAAQIRAAQKILFEVFSSIPEKKERSRLLNWANDAFIKSKFF